MRDTFGWIGAGAAWLWIGAACGGGGGGDTEGTGGATDATGTASLTQTSGPTTTAGSAEDSSGGDSVDADSTPPTSTSNGPGPGTLDTGDTGGSTTQSTQTTQSTMETLGETTTVGPGETTSDDTTGGTNETSTSTSTTSDDTTDTGDDTTGAPVDCDKLPVVFRDLHPLHVDFGCHFYGNMAYPGLVLPTLGGDMKPQYNPNPPGPPPNYNGSPTQITSAASFSDWYNTKNNDINVEIAGELQLMEIQPGIYSFASNMFYPLTGMGFGNNVDPNWAGETYPDWNGSFTTEIHTTFYYEAGQVFSFQGDDDVWVYIDGDLVMDLGGLHGPVMGTVMLDNLGLTVGQPYTLDVFHAERCDSGSNFRIDTSIGCFVPQ